MSYQIPNSPSSSGPCIIVYETTPADVWVPTGQIVQGLNQVYGVRGIGYHTRTVTLQVVGAANFAGLMNGLENNQDAISFGGHTYSLEPGGIEIVSIVGTQDNRDVAKHSMVTLRLWRP